MTTHSPFIANWHKNIVLLALFLMMGCSHIGFKEVFTSEQEQGGKHKVSAVPKQDLIGTLSCSSFEWIAYEGLSAKAAIKVPVELDGQIYWFQLDTGLDVTMLYGTQEAERRGWREVESSFVQVHHVRISGTYLPETRILVKKDIEPSEEIMGSLGLNFLVGHVVVIDFQDQRFCVIPRSDMPEQILKRTAFVPGTLRNNKFFVRVKVNDRLLDGIFYDTGSSAFPVVVDFKLWRELTGQSGGEGATHVLEVPSWGKKVPMIGAPLLGTLEIGSVLLEQPLVYYWKDQPEFFESWPFPATGLMGNSLFLHEVLVLDLGTDPRFGIFR